MDTVVSCENLLNHWKVPMTIYSVFSMFNVYLFERSHWWILLISWFKVSSKLLNYQSQQLYLYHQHTLRHVTVWRSLTYNRNRRVLRFDACGTPQFSFREDDVALFTLQYFANKVKKPAYYSLKMILKVSSAF